MLKVFLVKRMKIVHSIYSWFTETVLVKQYFLLSDFVLTSFHCICNYIGVKSGRQKEFICDKKFHESYHRLSIYAYTLENVQ